MTTLYLAQQTKLFLGDLTRPWSIFLDDFVFMRPYRIKKNVMLLESQNNCSIYS